MLAPAPGRRYVGIARYGMARKPEVRKPPVKSAPAQKPPVKKASAKKASVKKAPVKKVPERTYAVYVAELQPTRGCVHATPKQVYVGSTHEAPGHPATARIGDHLTGHNSKVVGKGYAVVAYEVVCSGMATRADAVKEEGRQARRLRASGLNVWCDRLRK